MSKWSVNNNIKEEIWQTEQLILSILMKDSIHTSCGMKQKLAQILD